jgi:hypothetical protein
MLSAKLRLLVFGLAIAYGVLGLLLFLFPRHFAPDFAWKVSPFVTMTMGGWCLGNAWLAWFTARRWRWSLVHPALLYLSVFGVTELLVLLWFRDKVVLDHAIAWLYLLTLAANGGTAAWCAVEAIRLGPPALTDGPQVGPWRYGGVFGFLVFVGFLGVYGLTAGQGDFGTKGGIFPEVLPPFTLRAFGAFYLSLMIGASPLLRDRSVRVFLNHGFVSYGLIIFITAAALAYINEFDFIDRPGGLGYWGAYLFVGVVFAISFWRWGTGAPAEAREAQQANA